MTKISVVIPFYYGNKYILKLFEMMEANAKALKNKLNGIELEVIIVNDSPECTVTIPTRNFLFQYKLLCHKRNEGIHQARITGLKASTGKYIVFLDQDDELISTALVDEIEEIKTADVLIANAWIEDKDGTRKILYRNRRQFFVAQKLNAYIKGHNRIVSPGHCLIKKEKIPREWMVGVLKNNGSDDLLLWILMLMKKRNFHIYHEAVYVHRYTGVNLSQAEDKMSKSSLQAARYMDRIPCIPKRIIKDFTRSRVFDLEWSKSSKLKKIRLISKNIDIIVTRIWWKIYSL